MRFLLDTCTLIWYFEGSDRIRGATREVLTDPGNELYMSDVSVLEVVIKYMVGTFPLPSAPSALLPALAEKHCIDSLPLTREAIFRLETLPPRHQDPFDRLLIAQALEHSLTLVTPDPLITRYRVATVWE